MSIKLFLVLLYSLSDILVKHLSCRNVKDHGTRMNVVMNFQKQTILTRRKKKTKLWLPAFLSKQVIYVTVSAELPTD